MPLCPRLLVDEPSRPGDDGAGTSHTCLVCTRLRGAGFTRSVIPRPRLTAALPEFVNEEASTTGGYGARSSLQKKTRAGQRQLGVATSPGRLESSQRFWAAGG